jgi:hypothetical protein
LVELSVNRERVGGVADPCPDSPRRKSNLIAAKIPFSASSGPLLFQYPPQSVAESRTYKRHQVISAFPTSEDETREHSTFDAELTPVKREVEKLRDADERLIVAAPHPVMRFESLQGRRVVRV